MLIYGWSFRIIDYPPSIIHYYPWGLPVRKTRSAATLEKLLIGCSAGPSVADCRTWKSTKSSILAVYTGRWRSTCGARAERPHPDQVRSLNHLAARAHGQVYRARRVDFRPMLKFLVTGFPQLARRHAVPLLFAIGVFYGTALASFVAIVNEPSTAYSLFDEGVVEYENVRMEKQQGEYRGNFTFDVNESSLVAAKDYSKQHFGVNECLRSWGDSGLPCLYLLIYNGRMLGTLEGLAFNHGFFGDFNALIMTHGVFELTAICISGGGGFLLARAIVAPGNLTRRNALKAVSRDAFGLLAGSLRCSSWRALSKPTSRPIFHKRSAGPWPPCRRYS